uniref:Uncharacterized protein n=1 Tax=Oryza glaberrima TaxID=4538 RepID=I1Q9W7_ORYGL
MDDIFNQYGMQLAKCMEVIDNLAARFEARKTQPGTDGMVKRSSYTCEIIRIVLWSALNYCEPNSKVLDLGIGIFKTDSVPYILCADNIIPTPSVLLLSRRWNSN